MSEEAAGRGFDPAKHLSKISGADYLEVKWRLVWLRESHPNALIDTELIRIDERLAIFKASVSIPDGGMATGFGSESPGDFRDFIEKAECVPLDSDILTRRGFVGFEDARIGEDVLAYDPDSDQCIWTPLRETKLYASGNVVEMTNRAGVAIRCTSDHSWAVVGGSLRKVSDFRAGDRVVLAAIAPGGGSPLTAEEAAIIGWMFTDGTIRRDGDYVRATIVQSKPETVATIRALVGSIAHETVGKPTTRTFPSGKTYSCLPQHSFILPAPITRALLRKAGIEDDADLPALATRLSVDARAAMLAAMMLADGDRRGNFAKKRKPGVMEAWRVLCTLQGIAISPLRDRAGMPTQRAKKRRYLCASELRVTPVGAMPVWCPTTDYGTWVMRQNGQVAITGNTKAIGRALAALGFGTQFTSDFNFGSDQGRVVDSPVRRGSNGNQGQRSSGTDGQGSSGSADRPATEPQRTFITRLIRTAGMDMDSAAKWCVDHGFTSETMTGQQASQFIDYLKPLAGYEEQSR